jgi:hypothetical protein
MGVKIKPTNVRQDFLIFMANCEWVRVRNSLSCPSYGDAEFVRVALRRKDKPLRKNCTALAQKLPQSCVIKWWRQSFLRRRSLDEYSAPQTG